MKSRQTWVAPLLGAGALLVAGCGGGGGGGDPLPADIALTIAGKIVGPNPAGAQVAVQVDAQSFVAEAAADGSYAVDITVSETLNNALVTMGAKLTGDQAFVELLSRLGSVAELKSQAGDDDSVDAGDNIRTNLSSLSTAEAVLIEEAGSGGKAALGSGVDAATALTLAAALELAATDPGAFALPQETSTTLELARDEAARAAFVADIESEAPEALEQARQSLVGNPDIVGIVTADDVPDNLLAATLQIGGDFPFNFFNLVNGVQFNNDGTGRFFNSSTNASISWSVANNRIRIEYDEPQQFTSFDFVDCDGDGVPAQEEAQLVETGFELVPLSATAVSFAGTTTRTFPDCPQIPAETLTSTGAQQLLDDDSTGGFTAADVAGASFVAPVPLPEGQDPISFFDSDLLQFSANGTGSGVYQAGAFTWAIEGGTLVVDFGDGVQARYRTVVPIDAVAVGVLVDSGSGGSRIAEVGLAFEADPEASLVEADVPGEYFQFGVGEENGGDARLKGFRLLLQADGSGAQAFDFIDENNEVTDTDRPFRWSIESGGLVLATYQDDSTGESCVPPVSGCLLVDERTLVPVNEDGERYYVFELRQFYLGGVEDGPLTYATRFYDRVPLPAKLAAATAPLTALPASLRPVHRVQR